MIIKQTHKTKYMDKVYPNKRNTGGKTLANLFKKKKKKKKVFIYI